MIEQAIAPAALIPACGLLLLSSTARLNSALGRIRDFHHEQLSVWAAETGGESRASAVRELRLEGLTYQTSRLIGRVSLLRSTMLQLFLAVACNLAAILGLALGEAAESAWSSLQATSGVVFVLGVIARTGAMGTSIAEVLRISETVEYEHERVERLSQAEQPPAAAQQRPCTPHGLLV